MYDKIKQVLWKRKYIFLFFFLFIIVLLQRFENKTNPNSGLENSIASDGHGYYAYLPASIIYQDFKYQYYLNPKNKIKGIYNPYISSYKEKYFLNKYYCGTSICLLPFFFIGIIISAIAGTDINGYTDTFLMLVSIASIFYYLLAAFLLTRIALFFRASEKIGLITALIFFFGTNLFHYVIQEPSMSHSYSFFAVTLFFYILTKVIINPTGKSIAYLALSLSLIALIRPPNIIVVLFIPFFFSNFKECGMFLKLLFTKHILKLLFGIFIFGLAILLQLYFYYLQTGDFIVESYLGETFNFLKPEIFNILFSYKKGLFLYTPLILATIVLIIFNMKDWYKTLIFVFIVSIFTYITASWWCWYYGGGFSGRPFIDIYPIFIITLIVLSGKLSIKWRKILAVIIIPFLFINQVMAYQYSHRILKGHEMTKELFITSFLQTSLIKSNENFKFYLFKNKRIIKHALENYENFTQNEYIKSEGFMSKRSYEFGDKFADSKNIKIKYDDLTIDINRPFYIVAECIVKNKNTNEKTELRISISDGNNLTKWDFVYDKQFNEDSKGWIKMSQVVDVNNKEFTKNGVISIYVHNEKGENLVDNFEYTIFQ